MDTYLIFYFLSVIFVSNVEQDVYLARKFGSGLKNWKINLKTAKK